MGWSGNARLNAKRDANEGPIIQVLRSKGYYCARINGKGISDWLVAKRPAFTRLVEIKNKGGRETVAQQKFRAEWPGPPIITLRTVDDALRFEGLAAEGW